MSISTLRGFRGVVAAAAVAVSSMLALQASAAIIYAVDDANNLFSFDSATPNNIISGSFISNLQSNEQIIGIDGRPATSELYALSSQSRIYKLNPSNGAATLVGSMAPTQLIGNSFGFDVNPVADRLRVTSDADQNLRLLPTTGAVAVTDPNVFYAGGDPNAGANPSIVGSAYTNSVNPLPPSPTTALFTIDSNLNILARQDAATAALTTIGALGVNVSNLVGFDIGGDGTAFAAFEPIGATVSSLYSINLTTGTASLVTGVAGTSIILGGLHVRDIAVEPSTGFIIPEPATALGLGGMALSMLARRRRTA